MESKIKKLHIIKDIDFIIECKNKNMSYREIGKLINISYVAVRQRYEKYKNSIAL